jgi:hypothetical protein
VGSEAGGARVDRLCASEHPAGFYYAIRDPAGEPSPSLVLRIEQRLSITILPVGHTVPLSYCVTMFLTPNDLHAYVVENYPEITDSRIDDEHWDLECTHCKLTRGFDVIRRDIYGTDNARRFGGSIPFKEDFDAPHTYLFRCPVCKAFKQWIVFRMQLPTGEAGKLEYHYFRITSLPSEGLEDIDELPTDPRSLRVAYRQAVRAMDANAHLAAAAMFRRAVQVITRDMLGVKRGNMANELREAVGKTYNGTIITNSFADVGYIIKEAGNQAAHPDEDPDLLDFSAEDAQDLQQIFMELVTDLFVVPAASQKARTAFMDRRKIKPKS